MADPSSPQDVWVNPYATPESCACEQRTDFPRYLWCSDHGCCVLTGKTYECPLENCPRPVIYHKYRRAGKKIDPRTGMDEFGMVWNKALEKNSTLDLTLVSFMEKLGQAPAFESCEFLMARENLCRIATRSRWLQKQQELSGMNLQELNMKYSWEQAYLRLLTKPHARELRVPSYQRRKKLPSVGSDSGVEICDDGRFHKQLECIQDLEAFQPGVECPLEIEATRRAMDMIQTEASTLRGQTTIMSNEIEELRGLWVRWASILKQIEYQGRGSVNWGVKKPWARIDQGTQQRLSLHAV
ncbi:hypothetical protein MKZ38_005017 [Zalerion maritima]|uniref:Uncharacterized protein n=1 Tax=Zalerion maritima TaxID=339359 RepID=A0AAD5RKQ9_9PEZI|nr:hypothetical protein MKZ38_005017 [Zalerion maritima]